MQHTTNEYEKLLEDHIKQYIEILDKTKDYPEWNYMVYI